MLDQPNPDISIIMWESFKYVIAYVGPSNERSLPYYHLKKSNTIYCHQHTTSTFKNKASTIKLLFILIIIIKINLKK